MSVLKCGFADFFYGADYKGKTLEYNCFYYGGDSDRYPGLAALLQAYRWIVDSGPPTPLFPRKRESISRANVDVGVSLRRFCCFFGRKHLDIDRL